MQFHISKKASFKFKQPGKVHYVNKHTTNKAIINPEQITHLSNNIGTNTPRSQKLQNNYFDKQNHYFIQSNQKKMVNQTFLQTSILNKSLPLIEEWAQKRQIIKKTPQKNKSLIMGHIRRQQTSIKNKKQSQLSKVYKNQQLPYINKIINHQKEFKKFIVQKIHLDNDSNHKDQFHHIKNDLKQANQLQKSQQNGHNQDAKLIKTQRPRINYHFPSVSSSIQLYNQRISRLNKIKQESPQLETSQILPQTDRRNNEGIIYSRLINPVKINISTSLSTLKQLLVQSDKRFSVSFDLPVVFIEGISQTVSQIDLNNKMIQIYAALGIIPEMVSIKKYINCVMIKEKNICILWHFNGKVYIGGWKDKQNGDGGKSGLGMEWFPQKYFYYGQFQNNMKNGYGVMKKFSKEIELGLWQNNHKNGWNKMYSQDGELIENGEYENGKLIKSTNV